MAPADTMAHNSAFSELFPEIFESINDFSPTPRDGAHNNSVSEKLRAIDQMHDQDLQFADDDEEVIPDSYSDVVLGRGGFIGFLLTKIVEEWDMPYKMASRPNKAIVIHRIEAEFSRRGGRFLRKCIAEDDSTVFKIETRRKVITERIKRSVRDSLRNRKRTSTHWQSDSTAGADRSKRIKLNDDENNNTEMEEKNCWSKDTDFLKYDCPEPPLFDSMTQLLNSESWAYNALLKSPSVGSKPMSPTAVETLALPDFDLCISQMSFKEDEVRKIGPGADQTTEFKAPTTFGGTTLSTSPLPLTSHPSVPREVTPTGMEIEDFDGKMLPDSVPGVRKEVTDATTGTSTGDININNTTTTSTEVQMKTTASVQKSATSLSLNDPNVAVLVFKPGPKCGPAVPNRATTKKVVKRKKTTLSSVASTARVTNSNKILKKQKKKGPSAGSFRVLPKARTAGTLAPRFTRREDMTEFFHQFMKLEEKAKALESANKAMQQKLTELEEQAGSATMTDKPPGHFCPRPLPLDRSDTGAYTSVFDEL